MEWFKVVRNVTTSPEVVDDEGRILAPREEGVVRVDPKSSQLLKDQKLEEIADDPRVADFNKRAQQWHGLSSEQLKGVLTRFSVGDDGTKTKRDLVTRLTAAGIPFESE